MPQQNQYSDPSEIALNREREAIQRILGYPPGWTLRWGITAVFIAVVIFMGMAWLIKYPDVITARAVIITEHPPIRIFSRSSGKISQLFVADKQAVEEGQLIALLENTADLEDLERLEERIFILEKADSPAKLMGIELPEGLVLGELQSAYANLQQAIKDFQFYERQQGVFAEIASLEQQIQYLEELNKSLRKQEETLSREVAIAEKDLNRNRELLKSGNVSELDVEESETNFLQYRRQLENLQSQVLNNKLQVEQFKARIIRLRQNRSTISMQKWLATREILERLKSELDVWKQTYLITSPISGRISLTRIWGAQQFVQVNEEVATLVPEMGVGAGNIIGKAALPTFNSGKVRPGQSAHIRLDGYPYQEYGVLKGKVKGISLVPDRENYLLEIELPDSLITSYNRTIPFTQELPGNARIITENRTILERVFDQVISLMRNE